MTPNYEDFLEQCSVISDVRKDPTHWNEKDYSKKRDVILEEWVVGGKHRSWNDDGAEPFDIEPEPYTFQSLDEVLEVFWPNITLLQYKKLCRELVQYASDTETDHYYEKELAVKFVILKDLYEYIIKNVRDDDQRVRGCLG